MGIGTCACIMVGLPGDEVGEADALLDAGDLEICYRYYDSGNDGENIIGFIIAESSNYYPVVLDIPLFEVIRNCKEKFRELTGLEPKVYLSPNVM